jgi:uncharacterized protein YcfL
MKLKYTAPFLLSLLCMACSPKSDETLANQQLVAMVDNTTVTFIQQQPTLSTMFA